MANPTDPRVFLELDSRKRISLGALAKHRLYLASVDDQGVIVLTPAVVMTAAEAEALGAES